MKRTQAWWAGAAVGLVLAAAPSRAETTWPTEKQYADIQAAFLREDFERVVKLVKPAEAAISREPRTTQVWLWYALSLDRLQRSEDALRELDRLNGVLSGAPAEEQTRVWPEALFWEGEISRRADKTVRARLAYQKLLTKFPGSSWRPQAHRGMGLVLFEQQIYDAAIRQFDEAASRASENSALRREAQLFAALCDIRRAHFQDALAGLQRLLDQGPALDADFRPRALFYMAESLTGLRRFEEAAGTYRQAIAAGSDSRWARLAQFGLGWSYFQQHQCAKSLDAFARYARFESAAGSAEAPQEDAGAHVEMLFAQGRCAFELGDEETALARFNALRAYDPEHDLAIEAGLSIAEILQQRQQFVDAAAILDSVFRQAFDSAQIQRAHLRLGAVYLAQGEAIKATAEFLLARESADDTVRQSALNGLGDAYALLGNAEEAARFFDASAAISAAGPSGLYATYQLGRLKLEAGKADEAVELFQRVAHDAPSAPASPPSARGLAAEARLALAFTFLSNDQPDTARSQLESLRAQDPRSSQSIRAGYYLALLDAQEGKSREAATLCRQVMQQAPQSDEAFEAQLLLADLSASESSPRETLNTLAAAFGHLSGVSPQRRGRLGKKLGDVARQAQSFSEAIRWYEVAWQAAPTLRGELEYRIASCYEEAGDTDVALRRYQAITQTPWDIHGRLAAARLLEREQRWPDAMTMYAFVAGQPVPEAKMAQERLGELIHHGDSHRSGLQ